MTKTQTRKVRIVWTDHTGRTRLFGSCRLDGVQASMASAVRYLGNAYNGRAERDAIIESVRAEW